jgi:hypothetical protein
LSAGFNIIVFGFGFGFLATTWGAALQNLFCNGQF